MKKLYHNPFILLGGFIMVKQFEGVILKFIFAALFIFLVLQHHYVYMYFDDYGHASLSYGHVVKGVQGTNFTFKNLVEWISWYYFTWGGRVFYYFLFLLPLLSKSVSLFMFIQSIIFFFIFVYLFKIIQSFNKQFNPILTILSLIGLYGLISIDLLKESAYWASASVCYIWSLLPLLMGIYYYMQATRKEKLKTWEVIFIPLLFFFAACSFEQSGAATLVFVTVYIFYLFIFRKKLHLLLSIPTILFSLFGVLIQYLSPGNEKRIMKTNPNFDSLSVFEKIRSGIPHVVNFIFDPRIFIFILILCVLSISIVFILFKNKKSSFYIFMIPNVLPVFFIIKYYFNFGIHTKFEFLLLLIIFFYFFLYMFQKPEFVALIFSVATSIFCLVLSPTLQIRSLVFFLILLFTLIVIVLNSIFVSLERNARYVLISILIVIAVFSFNNYKHIYLGYKENYTYAQIDHKKLLSLYGHKDITGPIKLYKYPFDLYREHMPYDPPTPYIKVWILQYYDLPKGTQIQWVDSK
jgi:hypothetical protein